MSLGTKSTLHGRPSYVMSADGEPEAVLIDFPTWKMILAYLEDVVDNQILSQAIADLKTLAAGNRPSGWQNWEAFEAELDALEQAGELPD
jgi:hypothetical protein